MTLEELWRLFPVFLTEHKPYWADWYEEEAASLKSVLPQGTEFFHVGSTAINGIMAKPIIDMLITVDSEKKLKRVLQKAVLKTEKRLQEYIIVSRERQKRKLFLDDICYFEIKGRLIDAHGTEGVFTYYEQIGVLENMLQGKGFFRCHKSYLINLKHVDGYNRQEAILDNGERILIAKRRYEGFCREILRYMRHNGGIG